MAKLDCIEIDGTQYELVPEIAPLFNTSTQYSTGDYVIKDAILYKFTTNHAAGAWNASHVTATSVVDEINGVVGDLSNLDTEDQSSIVDAINEVNTKAESDSDSGLTEDVKIALLACFEKVAWIDEDGQDYYDALYDALYPPTNLVSIRAVYTQSGTVYEGDSLDSLKPDLVVTAHFSDSSTQTITTYALSGTLTEGTSTITVTYNGKTTTFNVTVSEYVILYPLENGTHTFVNNNRTLTVSNGNHVEFDSSSFHTSGAYLNVSNVSDNDASGTGASNINNHATIFTIPSGSAVRFIVKNITASATETNIDIAFALRSGSSSAISSGNQKASSGTADALIFNDVEIETTASADIAVGCVFIYAVKETSTISADIELYVNNERWI